MDLDTLVRNADPVNRITIPPTDLATARDACDRLIAADLRRREPRLTFRARNPRHRAAIFGGASAAAAAVVAVLLTMGPSNRPNVTLPVLAQPVAYISRDIRHSMASQPQLLAGFGGPGAVRAALNNARSFPTPNGTGYVLQNPDGSKLCAADVTPLVTPAGKVLPPVVSWTCSPTATVAQQGLVITVGSQTANTFIALVPAGASVDLTSNGVQTPVTVDSGVATGVVDSDATLSIHVGGAINSQPVGPGQDQPTAAS
jgi:hypothetical protein